MKNEPGYYWYYDLTEEGNHIQLPWGPDIGYLTEHGNFYHALSDYACPLDPTKTKLLERAIYDTPASV